jgi:hypothetical protein
VSPSAASLFRGRLRCSVLCRGTLLAAPVSVPAGRVEQADRHLGIFDAWDPSRQYIGAVGSDGVRRVKTVTQLSGKSGSRARQRSSVTVLHVIPRVVLVRSTTWRRA